MLYAPLQLVPYVPERCTFRTSDSGSIPYNDYATCSMRLYSSRPLLGWHRALARAAAGILSLSLCLSLSLSLSLARLSPALYLLGPYRRSARCSDICTPQPVLNSAATNTVLSRVYSRSSSSRSNESTKGVVKMGPLTARVTPV